MSSSDDGAEGDDAKPTAVERPDFAALKQAGASQSRYADPQPALEEGAALLPDLPTFRDEIDPILSGTCLRCHGPDRQKGGVRIDTLDPDLFAGEDVDWWLEVLAVVTNGEMPPADEGELSEEDRGKVIEWLSSEVQRASSARRSQDEHTSFRRMTRYEYDYALQDLLGLPAEFTADLMPDSVAEDGFQNSSESLHLSAMQFRAYLDASRTALRMAVVTGDQPAPISWGISMEAAAAVEWSKQDDQVAKIRKDHKDKPEELDEKLAKALAGFEKRPGGAHYEDLSTGRLGRQTWHYSKGLFAWEPTESSSESVPPTDTVAVIPRGRGLIVELGDRIPEEGKLRVRVRASQAPDSRGPSPSLQLHFGWRASNDSRAVIRVDRKDQVVDAEFGSSGVYEWEIPIGLVEPRNSVRATNKMGDLPSPSEYLKLVNASLSGGSIHVHSMEVEGPIYDQWPPANHVRIFGEGPRSKDEVDDARETLLRFMAQAWRRTPSQDEVDRKYALFERLRPEFPSYEEAMVEVLATVLSSPNFLYLVVQPGESNLDAGSPGNVRLSGMELATRLSMFLWCSTPDGELSALASDGRLASPEILDQQIDRMLADVKSRRFSKHFVRQWLNLPLLDYLQVDKKSYPQYDVALREAMGEEPIAFFHEGLQQDFSALEFLHSEFTLANERLARHYELEGVVGNHFRRVELDPGLLRGGLLAQAGLLAMNSDGEDSHPLKRGVWLLERLLDDPPPPPPPAVPEIDLTDPEIAKLTLKEQIERHRDHAACMSCHAKIDPWGIAFENFDAIGSWRTEVDGEEVDALGVLFNGQELDGMDGLKSFLLANRQDQFVRALVQKLATYGLGRPLTFQDRAAIDGITANVRRHGDGLATMVKQIATSDLFLTK